MKRSVKKRPSRLFMQLSVVAAAVVLFIVILGFFSGSSQSSNHSGVFKGQSPKASNSASAQPPGVIVKKITFTGESKHWEAINKVYIRNYHFNPKGKFIGHSFKVGAFKLAYKGKLPRKHKGKFSYSVKGSEGTTEHRDFPENGVITNKTVYGEFKKDQIKVTVKWDGKKETFKMTSQPKTFQKKSFVGVPQLSKVKGLGKKHPFMGITDSGAFQMAANGWGEQDLFMEPNKKVAAYLVTKGKNFSQTVFLLFPDLLPADDIKIVGEHDGRAETLYKNSEGNGPILSNRISGKDEIPAVLQFGTEGLWRLTAYVNKKKVGQVRVFVFQDPAFSGDSEYRQAIKIHGRTLNAMFAKFTANWSRKNGQRFLRPDLPMRINLKKFILNGKPLPHLFPIFVVGTPLLGGDPFIQAINQADVAKQNNGYQLDTTLPIRSAGKWELSVYEGETFSGGITFYTH